MNEIKNSPFNPNYAVPPGAVLEEWLEERGMSQTDLAGRMDRPIKTINELIKGKISFTQETAFQLEAVTGIEASFWRNADRIYQERASRLGEEERLKSWGNWASRFPISDMVRLGWISPAVEPRPRVRALLRFFGVASPEAWEVVYGGFHFTYRKSPAFTSDPAHLAAWLRQGELAATQMDCLAYDQIQFKGALCALRGWTTTPFVHAEANLVKLCQLAGVAVATVPELPKTRVSGATRWVTSSKALIQLSLRNRTSDCLWFAFFHEAAHILLHGKKEVFVEFDGHEDPKEKEADRWAENFLIPRSDWRHFVNAGDPKRIDIQSFAEELRIDPGIVAGRLQREKRIPFTTRNDLKRRSRCLAAEAEVVSTR